MINFGKVAVLYGGESAERGISLLSGQAVVNGLQQLGVDVYPFDTQQRPLSDLVALHIDRVFNVLHGRGGEDGQLQGALEYLGIPYTGSGVLGSALAMDKVKCKQLFTASDLATAEFIVVEKNRYLPGKEAQILKQLGGKVFIKPAHEGSSIGMSFAQTPAELAMAVDSALTFDELVLIEAFIDGPEYTVAILNGTALPVIELRTPRAFYDYHAKYQSTDTEYICPCQLDSLETEIIQRLALEAFNLVDGRGWGRVDLMRDQSGEFMLLEVNTVPGMTEKSLVPMAAKVKGLTFEQLLLEILATSLNRTTSLNR